MAAFGFGIGDILLLINGVLKLYGSLREAPQELMSAKKDVEMMEMALKVFNDTFSDRESMLTTHSAIGLIIKADMDTLKPSLNEMKDILSDFIREPNVSIMGRVRYAVLDKSRLKSIQNTFSQVQKNLSFMMDFLNMKANDKNLRNSTYSVDLLNKIHEKQRADEAARKAEQQERYALRNKVDKILQHLEMQRVRSAQANSPGPDSDDIVSQLQNEMEKSGIPQDQVKKVSADAAQAISAQSLQAVATSSNTDKVSGWLQNGLQESCVISNQDRKDIIHSEHLSSGQKGKYNSPPKAERPTAVATGKAPPAQDLPLSNMRNQKTTSIEPAIDTRSYRILIVDDSISHVRVLMAHAYFELCRVFTANFSGRWLFKRVDSVSLTAEDLPTTMKAQRQTAITRLIEQVLPPNHYRWASSQPDEIGNIRSRLISYNIGLISNLNLSAYSIIICFSQADLDQIRKLQNGLNFSPVPLLLKGTEQMNPIHCWEDRELTARMHQTIKSGVTQILGVHFRPWSFEYIITLKQGFHTLQCLIPQGQLRTDPKMLLDDNPVLKAQETVSGCSIRITQCLGNSLVLVSIYGPHTKLELAKSLVIKAV